MDNITSSELAGFGVGTLLLCATIAAPKIDAFFSASQRSSLGLCKRCGNLRRIACSRCRGTGSVREGAIFAVKLVEDLYETLGSNPGKQQKFNHVRSTIKQYKSSG
ncbi:uncharacterized protein LOC129304949 isoform X2 [Prosopis cineraria]|uniref:uncharacterized protein LOC129299217 isoform X2 n=1 Tax=Prosopis cineraria TaxID=364024 RepID=UPI0024107C2E|nr:uncharacterized protein LOC129299217 isoform X2 [Prosopis cineraria]XP_054800776.1 uncharacterized protein LOC129304949 isoform X2 [Prosopis cineraria]